MTWTYRAIWISLGIPAGFWILIENKCRCFICLSPSVLCLSCPSPLWPLQPRVSWWVLPLPSAWGLWFWSCRSLVSVWRSPLQRSAENNQMFFNERFWIYWSNIGNTLLEGVCIRLTWHLHTHDICYEYEGSFMHVSQCHSLSYDILYTNMMLFEMSLWQLDITKTTQPVINMT